MLRLMRLSELLFRSTCRCQGVLVVLESYCMHLDNVQIASFRGVCDVE